MIQGNFRLLLATLVFVAACGEDKIGQGDSTSSISTTVAADSLTDVSDAIADDSSTSSSREFMATSLPAEAQGYAPQGVTLARTCTQGATLDPVTVNVTFSGSESKSLTLPKVSVSSSVSASGTLERVWTAPSGVTIACNGAATHVLLNWASNSVVNGLNVTQTANRARNASHTVTKSSGATVTKTNNFSFTGTRSVTWATGDGVSGVTVTRTKTIVSDVTRTATMTDKNGDDQTFTSRVATQSGAPLVVDVVRSASAPYALKAKTVKSGTVVATRTGTDRIESTFSNVFYDMTSSSPCLPSSGTVTLKYFSTDDATEATKTYTVTFGADTDSGVSIAEEGGSTVDFEEYAPSGCDLEKEI